MRKRAGVWCAVCGLALIPAIPMAAQGPPQKADVYQAITHDVSRPLHEMARSVVQIPGPAQQVFLGRIPFTQAGPEKPDTAAQGQPLPYQTVTAGAGFRGLGADFPGFTVQYAPPDTNGAAGTTQYVQWVNASFAVFDKATGAVLQGPTPGNALWQGFGGGCENNNDGDPIVQFDKAAGRWVFTQFSVSTKPYLQCFAISQTDDALGSYFRFAFSFGNSDFPDYPKLAVWPDGYYLSFNIFRNGFFFTGPRACAVDRSKALAGQAPTMICFQLSSSTGSLLPSDLDGATPPPSGSPNYFASFATNSLQIRKFFANFTNPGSSQLVGPTTLAVASFTPACNGGTCIPQPGTGQKLDSLGDRLMYRAAYRNRAGVESLVLNHSIKASGAPSEVRWYEVRISNKTPALYQQGTLASGDGISRWMGSIAMDKCGNIGLGYSAGSGSVYPSIRFTGRTPTDPSGSMQTESILQTGAGSQLPNLNRWGDYSSISLDPVDDATMWYTTEYLLQSGTFNWSTRIAPVKINNCQ